MKNAAMRAWLTAALLSLALAFIRAGAWPQGNGKKFVYPAARQADVVEDYHGTKVRDPYRWLEDADSPETRAWVEAENALTSNYLKAIPAREKIKARLLELLNYPRYSLPREEGGRYFFSKNDGLQNQAVLYAQNSLDTAARVLLDPNPLSADGTIALTGQAYSRDGKLLAYALSESGSDWQEIKIRNVDTGRDYDDVLRRCKFSSVAWEPDRSGFFYNRYPDAGAVPKEDESNYNRVYWHKLGTPQSADELIYDRPEEKELDFAPLITDDGKYLVLVVYHGTDPKNRIYYREAESHGPFIRLLDEADAKYDPLGNVGATFFVRTDLDAPRGRVISIDLNHPERKNWKQILPEQDAAIDFATLVNSQIVVAYLRDAHHEVKIYDLNGAFVREVPLPAIGSIGGISGKQFDTEMFFGFASFLYPTTIYRFDFKTGELAVFRRPEVRFDPSAYETRQVFYTSRDGTRVPMFLTQKRGLKLDGSNPTLLFGYGGFDIGETPSFSASRLVWLEHGGIYAVANLRGGNEYGEVWHQAGMLEKKQNVFDDFISAAEWLIRNKVTSTARLAINGRSNGGLLVAACLVQRPDLFGAAVPEVPVIDMLRYHKFTVGHYWVPEFGNAETNAEHFKFLVAYSPLHNVKPGVAYPPTLVTTADTDDRVSPAHAKKFTATLQAADAGSNPLLLRVETKAGHGFGKPITKLVEELSDLDAFLFKTFGMEFASPPDSDRGLASEICDNLPLLLRADCDPVPSVTRTLR